MTEGQRGLNIDFARNSLSFSTHTHTHESDNHSNGYGHPKTAIMRSFSGAAGNQFSSNGEKIWNDFGFQRNYNF
jgi:hypothetical protein